MSTRHIRVLLGNGEHEDHQVADLIDNLRALSFDLSTQHLDFALVEQKLVQGFSANMSRDDFIKYQAETLAYLNLTHPDYALLAARVLVQELHRTTESDLERFADSIYNFSEKGNRKCNLLNDQTY